ncbi:MAG TPA: hypothetical protein VII12_01910 [Thermoanaerobaculia bacterium]
MKADTLLTKAAAGLGTVALALTLSACSHHNALEGQDYGNVRTEQTAQQTASTDQVIAAAPAPANAQGVSTPSTPAIISGPAKVDESGRLYTSSSVGATGNASGTGLNTNVNIIPKQSSGTVTVTEVPAPAPVVTETTTTVVETPAPEPVVVETPAPAPPVVEETPAPMTSSTTETTTTTTTTHRRLRKD